MQCARLLHKVLKCAAKFTAGSYSHNICRALEAEKTFPPSLLSPTCPAPQRLTSAPVAAVPLRVDGFSSRRDARAATPLPLTLLPRGTQIYICTAAQFLVLQANSQIHAALIETQKKLERLQSSLKRSRTPQPGMTEVYVCKKNIFRHYQ